MLSKDIYQAAAFCLALTYSGQVTIIKKFDGKEYHGYFEGNQSEDRFKTNCWRFYSFRHAQFIDIPGNEIESVSLEESNKRLFYIAENVKENLLHLSNNPHTVTSNYYFTSYPLYSRISI
jgi:hypothetical protein